MVLGRFEGDLPVDLSGCAPAAGRTSSQAAEAMLGGKSEGANAEPKFNIPPNREEPFSGKPGRMCLI